MGATTLASPPPLIGTFPKSTVEAGLRQELIEAIKIEAAIRGETLPSASDQVAKAFVQVDSLVVVSILCTVEPIVGFELPDSVVRAGGYTSVEAALLHLLPRIEKEWTKKKGANP